VVSIASLQKVLQNLLSEMISIRDMPSILESVADSARANKNLTAMTEAVRVQLCRQICHHNTNREGFIPIIALSAEWERNFIENIKGAMQKNSFLLFNFMLLNDFEKKQQEFTSAFHTQDYKVTTLVNVETFNKLIIVNKIS
jgi:flagellar biosynthesis component FlhA